MELTFGSLLIYLLIAAVAGALGRAIAGGTRGGCLVSIALGFIGGILGSWISRKAGLPEPLLIQVGGANFPFFWSIIGAALFVAVVVLISGRR
ncbi:MAG TPA: hypothetical protein VKG01_12740 [Thermoanaerobaculia bacterium]|nr:hypothetical protein [Thermoanaerobaculia bacterium]